MGHIGQKSPLEDDTDLRRAQASQSPLTPSHLRSGPWWYHSPFVLNRLSGRDRTTAKRGSSHVHLQHLPPLHDPPQSSRHHFPRLCGCYPNYRCTRSHRTVEVDDGFKSTKLKSGHFYVAVVFFDVIAFAVQVPLFFPVTTEKFNLVSGFSRIFSLHEPRLLIHSILGAVTIFAMQGR